MPDSWLAFQAAICKISKILLCNSQFTGCFGSILDILMPEMDGIEVMQALNEVKRDDYLPILVLTVELDHDVRNRALLAGGKDFLTKPFDYTEVLNRIRNMLEVRFMHNQLRDQNQHLEREVKRRTKELKKTRLGTIQRLGRVAEYRDNETGMREQFHD